MRLEDRYNLADEAWGTHRHGQGRGAKGPGLQPWSPIPWVSNGNHRKAFTLPDRALPIGTPSNHARRRPSPQQLNPPWLSSFVPGPVGPCTGSGSPVPRKGRRRSRYRVVVFPLTPRDLVAPSHRAMFFGLRKPSSSPESVLLPPTPLFLEESGVTRVCSSRFLCDAGGAQGASSRLEKGYVLA